MMSQSGGFSSFFSRSDDPPSARSDAAVALRRVRVTDACPPLWAVSIAAVFHTGASAPTAPDAPRPALIEL